MEHRLSMEPPSFSGRIGVAKGDITPPIGIYARCWGAAKHDVAEGIHRAFSLTTMAMFSLDQSPPLLLVAMDGPWMIDQGNERRIREHTLDALGLDESRLILNLSHSHASASISACHADKPGGEMIAPYVEHIADTLLETARQAITTACPATLSVSQVTCPMVSNRDLPDPGGDDRILCGWNPEAHADQTLLVGRVTDNDDGRIIATFANVACHPTTLAWENKLLSPDYVGAMREVVESHTGEAPCLFLQGASGEQAPREQYTGDVAVADRHGRCLGYSVLSALESTPPHACTLTYKGIVESGAPLGVWKSEPFDPPTQMAARKLDINLPLRPRSDFTDDKQPIAASATNHWQLEREFRARCVSQKVGDGPTTMMPAWVWRVGRILFIGQPNEAYSDFQRAMRQEFSDDAVIVMNLCNADSGVGYICPPLTYDGPELYQAWQSPFDRDAMPQLIAGCIEGALSLTGTT